MSQQPDNPRQEPEQIPAQEPVNSPEPEKKAPEQPEKPPISEKKRTALLRYMAVLFGVAFLLVLLSFLIQIRDSRETISDLNKSNASALQNAVQLQEQNQALTTAKEELTLQLEDTKEDLEDARQETEEAKAQQEEAETAFVAEESLRQSYELLFTAARHYENGAWTECMNVLVEQLKPEDVEAFSADARAYYDQLKTRCQEKIDANAAQTAEE